jgi:YgiT-type zinc finger domain-containing protein
MSNLCSLCKKEGVLIEDNESIFYKGEYIDVSSLYFYECTSCGEHFVDANLDKANSEKIQKAKEAFDNMRKT